MRQILSVLILVILAGCAASEGPGRLEELEDTEKVWVGMSKQAVLAAWGHPDEINHMSTSLGAREQWVYGVTGSQRYLYFEHDHVVQIEY